MSAFALVQNLGEFLKLLLEAFNLASIFPAFVFVTLTQMFLMPLLPETSPLRIDLIPDLTIRTGFYVVLTVLLGYLLQAANFLIIRFFEGYIFREQYPFKFFENELRKSVKSDCETRSEIENVILQLIQSMRLQGPQQSRCKELTYKLKPFIEKFDRQLEKYPYDHNKVLLSPLGNIVARAEGYSYKLFCIDAVTLWGFLGPILNKNGYGKFIVREKSMLDFLLNLIVSVFVFCCLYGFGNWWYEGWSLYLIIFLFGCFMLCLFIFQLALRAAASWGTTIKVAFILFREDLRVELGLRSPKSYKEERDLWRSVSEFFQARYSSKWLEEFDKSIFCYGEEEMAEWL